MIVSCQAVQLTLSCEVDPTSAPGLALARDLPGRALRLQRWGRFVRPVTLHLAADATELRQRAPLPSLLDLRGLAWCDDVWLLAPHAWPEPPSDPAFANLVAHELAHVLWFQRTTPLGRLPSYTPTWFREGFAVVASEGPPPAAGRRALCQEPILQAAFANDAAIADLGGICYQIAAQLFTQWWQDFGARGLSALCREMRGGRPFSDAFEQASAQEERAYVAAQVAAWRAEAQRS